mgnify:CR=1 FL=1
MWGAKKGCVCVGVCGVCVGAGVLFEFVVEISLLAFLAVVCPIFLFGSSFGCGVFGPMDSACEAEPWSPLVGGVCLGMCAAASFLLVFAVFGLLAFSVEHAPFPFHPA